MDLINKIKEKGYSAAEIAEGTGIPLPRIYKWLQGKSQPKAKDARDLEFFLNGIEEKPKALPVTPPDHSEPATVILARTNFPY